MMTNQSSPGMETALPAWEDADVQLVYNMLCDDALNTPPNPEEHWEGWISRNIVAALRAGVAQNQKTRCEECNLTLACDDPLCPNKGATSVAQSPGYDPDEMDDFIRAVLADNNPRSDEPYATVAKWIRRFQTRSIRDIAAERQRQISQEGWTSTHDDQHNTGEMARAAASYALSAGPEKVSDLSLIYKLWPWEWRWFKPRSKREDLVRAGALIAAEIERLDRLTPLVPSTDKLCAKCGCETKGEAALVGDEVWCHPCADACSGPLQHHREGQS